MKPDQFLRGIAWPPGGDVPYPRADPADIRRLPADTWEEAKIPVGVRLEIDGDASSIDIDYLTTSDDLGYRGPGSGTTFAAWRGGRQVDEQAAVLGRSTVRMRIGRDDGRTIVYLPEGMRPTITSLEAVDGQIKPASEQPRWLAYGDSIGAGWVASTPAMGWVAIAGRDRMLDCVNLGYAGSARGETSSAEQIAKLRADVITLTHGTNCWSMIPHSGDMMRSNTDAFVRILRSQQKNIPIVVVSPLLRPDAEDMPNRLGATMASLREAMEDAIRALNDPFVRLISGRDLLSEDMLADGIHPNDTGHRTLASALGPVVREAYQRNADPATSLRTHGASS